MPFRLADCSPRGCLRAAGVECLRGTLPPDEPGILRALAGLGWRLERAARPQRAAALAEQAERTFGLTGPAAHALVREAHDVDLQRRLEELVLPRVERFWLARYVATDDPAGDPRPALYLELGAPHPLLGIVALSAARPGLLALHPDRPPNPASAPADRWLRARFAAWRQELPVLWSPRVADAARALGEGRSIHASLTRGPGATPEAAIASATVLGAPLADLLAQLPAGTPVRLLLTHRERDKRWGVEVTGDVAPAEVAGRLAAHVRRWPGQFLAWARGEGE